MSSDTVYDTIQKTIRTYLPDSRILLFGSRARGDYDKHSDYDLLIITPEKFPPKEKINWMTVLNRAIIEAIHAPVDVLVFGEDEITEKKELPGHIVRTAIREGIAL
jgi:predicted nucleotidyltransferase